MTRTMMTFAALVLVGACSGQPDRLALAPAASTLSLQPAVRSAVVRSVSLPSYAAADDIAVEAVTGLISADTGILWADDPQRAVTQSIASTLGGILGVAVGAEPWPFVGLPDVAVDVRVSRIVAGADGVFQLDGQYFVGGDGIDYRNRARSFAIRQPMVDQSLGSITAAQSAALGQLSEQIARDLAR